MPALTPAFLPSAVLGLADYMVDVDFFIYIPIKLRLIFGILGFIRYYIFQIIQITMPSLNALIGNL